MFAAINNYYISAFDPPQDKQFSADSSRGNYTLSGSVVCLRAERGHPLPLTLRLSST